MVTSHQVVLSGLVPGTVYYYQVDQQTRKVQRAQQRPFVQRRGGPVPSITYAAGKPDGDGRPDRSFSVSAAGTAR